MTPVLIATLPVFFQWFYLLVQPMGKKYAYLSGLAVPGPYFEAVRADELWLIALMMSAIGLLTAMKWQFLFPDLRDYRVLGALPLRPRQIFGAKLAALLLVAAATLVTIDLLPSVVFPALSASRWALHPSFGARVLAHAGASAAASSFFFFGLVALQGVLLNLLKPRAFGRVTGYLQGCLVAIMLGLIVLSFSIQPQITNALIQPEWARWLPPVWFLGLYQTLSGDPDPAMRALAHRAWAGLAISVVVALVTYVLSYHRHRTLLVEGTSGPARDRRGRMFPGWLATNPRQQAVVAFMTQTLVRSNRHRTILMGYAGLGFAVILTGLISMPSLVESRRVTAADFIYYHILALLLLSIGARHVFSLPTELNANWIFQITEGEGREAWLSALDRFVLFWGAVVMFAIPLPLEIRLLGWRAIAEQVLFLALGLLTYEWFFSSWCKLPFTCSYLPGRMPVWMILAFFGLLGVVAAVHSLLLVILYGGVSYAIVVAGLLAAWRHVRRGRRQGWVELRLKYDDVPEPAVHGLNLLK